MSYTGFKELLADTIEKDPIVRQLGLAAGAVYRADTVYDTVDHEEFLVLRFGEPSARSGDTMVIPWDILGYCGSGNTDKMKGISFAARSAAERIERTVTDSGHFRAAMFQGIGADQYDSGFRSIVLVTHMSCLASGY